MQTDAPDLGADGPAALAREARTVTIGGAARGSVATERIVVRRVTVECHLDWLLNRSLITRRQHRAGSRFRACWAASVVHPAVTAQLERVAAVGRSTAQECASDARATIDGVAGLLTQLEWAAVAAVCGEDEPSRNRLRWLTDGLSKMADEWGYE